MQRTVSYLIIILLATLTACKGDDRSYRIGVSQCSVGNWRTKLNNEMLAAQHLYEQDVTVEIVNCHDDSQVQLHQIDSLLEDGVDLLVVAPNDYEQIVPALMRAKRKGVPIIFFDRKTGNEDQTAFIGGDNVATGRTSGLYALTLARSVTGHKPRILEVAALQTTSPASERHKGFAAVMEGRETEVDYVCVMGDWSADSTFQIVSSQLQSQHRPDIVFCHSDYMATGACRAVKEQGMEGEVKIIGVDGLPGEGEGIEMVKQGLLAGTCVYPTHGEQIVRLALDILTEQPYQRENLLQGMMITPENVDLVSLYSNELMQQNLDIVVIHDKLEQYFGLYNSQRKLLVASLVAIVLLLVGTGLSLHAFMQMRHLMRQRQSMNEEQTLFYTNPDNRTLLQVFEPQPEELPKPRTQDAIFAETLNEAIRQNMSNPALKMDELGEQVGLSRVQLYRKVKAITGLTPVELLRQMRLQRAYGLLITTNKTVAEVAYEVGFATPGYFSKCFRHQFGKYPTELRS